MVARIVACDAPARRVLPGAARQRGRENRYCERRETELDERYVHSIHGTNAPRARKGVRAIGTELLRRRFTSGDERPDRDGDPRHADHVGL
jgi:hypothetical protein